MSDEAKHTPGPWGWFGNAKGNNLYLSTVHGGRRFVMQFDRWGMRSAQPVFQSSGVMKPATEFLTFEVGDHGITGYEAAKGDASVYRYDVAGIDHPDARLIAAAPDLLEACREALRVVDEAYEATGHFRVAKTSDQRMKIEAAIFRATGGAAR